MNVGDVVESLLRLGIISVRWFVLCSVGGVLNINVMAQSKISLTTNGIGGVEILDNRNIATGLVTTLRSTLGGGLLPYTIVVRNTGSLPITGLDVRYEIVTKGDEVVNNFFYGSPDDMASSASLPIIAPGGSAVISPNHTINEQIMSWGGVSPSTRATLEIGGTVDFFNKADQIKISIDSVIRSDGVIVGPDRSERFRIFQQEISEYTRFRDELLKRFSAGESDASITSWLEQTASLRVMRRGKNKPSDRGAVMRRSLAQQYLALMEKGQREYCSNELRDAPPEVRLKRIFRVRQEVHP
jgi:hypothetical protein